MTFLIGMVGIVLLWYGLDMAWAPAAPIAVGSLILVALGLDARRARRS